MDMKTSKRQVAGKVKNTKNARLTPLKKQMILRADTIVAKKPIYFRLEDQLLRQYLIILKRAGYRSHPSGAFEEISGILIQRKLARQQQKKRAAKAKSYAEERRVGMISQLQQSASTAVAEAIGENKRLNIPLTYLQGTAIYKVIKGKKTIIGNL
jgi:hypothetical protein